LAARQVETDFKEEKTAQIGQRAFIEEWTTRLVVSIDGHPDEETRIELMESLRKYLGNSLPVEEVFS
jgi:hypothetical protein